MFCGFLVFSHTRVLVFYIRIDNLHLPVIFEPVLRVMILVFTVIQIAVLLKISSALVSQTRKNILGGRGWVEVEVGWKLVASSLRQE